MFAIRFGAWIRARIALLVFPMLFACVAGAQSGLVISQVYGGGGNTGAPYSYDFIELYNSTSSPISLNGLSVQYASAAGTSWNPTALPNVSLAAGHYFLIQEAEGTTVTNKPLPTPDATGSINMSATAGKVALVNGATAITSGTSCPTGTSIIDFVGFGTTANCFEGSGPTPAPSNTTSVTRTNNADTNNNAADFTAGAPNPRNSSFGSTGSLGATGAANPSTVTSGGTTLLTVTVTPGTGSTGIAVTADLSGIGGSATQAFYDDGSNGDVTPGDNVFSFSTTCDEQHVEDVLAAGERDGYGVGCGDDEHQPHGELAGAEPGDSHDSRREVADGDDRLSVRGTDGDDAGHRDGCGNGWILHSDAGRGCRQRSADARGNRGLHGLRQGAGGGGHRQLRAGDGHSRDLPCGIGEPHAGDGDQHDLGDGACHRSGAAGADHAYHSMLTPSGGLYQLTPYEGMRVSIPSMTSISGTGGNLT